MSPLPPLDETLPRRERERLRKTQEFLAVAGDVFGRKGFHGASMEEIAKAAEYAVGALYRYFASKEVLYVAVLEAKFLELLAFLEESTRTKADPVEKVKAMVQARMDFASRNRAFIQIYFRERMEVMRAGENWSRIDDLHRQLIDFISGIIAAGQKQRVFRSGEPRLYALAFEGIIYGLLRDWMNTEPAEPLNRTARFISEMSLRGILKTT